MPNRLYCSLLLALFVLPTTEAQVVINEYSASNLHSYRDNYEKSEDWIELYNVGDAIFDLSGYHLSDKKDKPKKWKIPDGTFIQPHGFLTFWCSDRNEFKDGHFHTNFKISQTTGKDEVIFAAPNGSILDEARVEVTLVEHSICRAQDGTGSWMICTASSLNASNDPVEKYNSYSAAPTIQLEAGFYSGSQRIVISNNEPNSIVRYTLNGALPTENSPEYIDTIQIDKTTLVKARAFSNDPDIFPGKICFKTYFIDEVFSVPVYSIGSEQVQQLANGNGDLKPVGSLEFFSASQNRVAATYGDMNRHGQDSWQLDHRSIDWVSRDEMGYSKEIKAPLFAGTDRNEFQRIIFRNSGDDNYPAINDADHEGSTHIRDEYVHMLAFEGGMKLDVRKVQRAVVFLNGEYWGLYGVREKPVDHDYTNEYYDQDKYNLYYLSTWGQSQARYGGRDAFNDWYQLRDFILENDMSDPTNYEVVKDQLQVLGLIDYMIANLNSVAKDWLNYNTGWWRGLNPDGDHKKWGYILWDLDATFGYYINYTGVPNIEPDAEPCDLEDISNSMDNFWGDLVDYYDCSSIRDSTSNYPAYDGIFQEVVNQRLECCTEGWSADCDTLYNEIKEELLQSPDQCTSILNGTCPYPPDDSVFLQVIANQDFCCNFSWFDVCQESYDNIAAGMLPSGNDFTEIRGNVGKHEKIFLKLLEENPDFLQLYYSRQSDLKNTVYSCANMMETLERMLAVIEPEMPRQIERWGGSLGEWKSNVGDLRDFIAERCSLLDTGMVSCYNLAGPFHLTLQTQPSSVGEIQLNTLTHKNFPWTGTYFGGMEQLISAKSTDDEYAFSHWISTSGHLVFPDETQSSAYLSIERPDTLIAVFETAVSTERTSQAIKLNLFPNPTDKGFQLEFELPVSANLDLSLVDIMGKKVQQIVQNENQGGGFYKHHIDLQSLGMPAGVYFVRIQVNEDIFNRRVLYLK